MSRRRPGQQVARRRLGSALRTLREDANVRIDAAARELECSPAKISRLENGLGPAKLWDVRILLTFYGVTDPRQRTRFEEWARDTKSAGWWEPDSDLTTEDIDHFLSVETVAARQRIYATPVLPSLLQTPEYAAAQIRARNPQWSAADVDRYVKLRLDRRHAALRTDEPLHLDVVLDESAVRRRVGGRTVHAAQLSWLADLLDGFAGAGRDSLTVRILPLAAGTPGRALSAFAILEPAQPDLDPLSAHVEGTLANTWPEPADISRLVEIFHELRELSLEPEQTRHFLREILEEM